MFVGKSTERVTNSTSIIVQLEHFQKKKKEKRKGSKETGLASRVNLPGLVDVGCLNGMSRFYMFCQILARYVLPMKRAGSWFMF